MWPELLMFLSTLRDLAKELWQKNLGLQSLAFVWCASNWIRVPFPSLRQDVVFFFGTARPSLPFWYTARHSLLFGTARHSRLFGTALTVFFLVQQDTETCGNFFPFQQNQDQRNTFSRFSSRLLGRFPPFLSLLPLPKRSSIFF